MIKCSNFVQLSDINHPFLIIWHPEETHFQKELGVSNTQQL